MSDWVPIIAGFAIIVFAIGVVRFAPNSVWAQELRRSYGIRPTGERGNRTRRDHLLSAGLAGLMAALLLATSVVASAVAEGLPDETRGHSIALAYMLAAFMLGIVAVASTLRSLWKATAWRMELPDTPEHRRRLADALDHLLDGGLTPDERREYLDVVYLQPQLEQIRRATLKLSTQYQTGLPDDFRVQIKRWTAGIRASAGPAASHQGGPRE
jgi:hypothetical protein